MGATGPANPTHEPDDVGPVARPPATPRLVDADARDRYGMGPGTLRLSVGLEDPEDLWRDLTLAFDHAASRIGATT